MAVRIKFDSTHNILQPTFVLATRNGTKLGTIPAYNQQATDNLNSCFELSFKVQKFNQGKEYLLWDELKDFKLVWCKEYDIWFEATVKTDEENDVLKTVSCKAVGESELSQIMVYNTEINTEDDISRSDYVPTVFYNEKNKNASLLHRVMDKATHYTIKHVDDSLKNIQRTFKFDGKSIYDVFQEIANEIDCIFIINSGTNAEGKIAREINVYDLESFCPDCGNRGDFVDTCPKCQKTNIIHGYGDDTSIFVSKDNLANSISYETDVNSVKNCFKLEAGDDLMTATIANCNPNGSSYIWHISDEQYSDMSDELSSKIKSYNKDYQYYEENHSITFSKDLVDKYNALVQKYVGWKSDLRKLPYELVGYSSLMDMDYDTIDMQLYLEHSMMPDVSMQTTNAKLQAAKLSSSALTPVAVTSLTGISVSTAASVVLSVAKVIVDSRYQVKVKESSLSGTTWKGNFVVTNYSDEDDTAVSAMVSVTITDSYEYYLRQIIKRALDNIKTDIVGIVELFDADLNTFKAELKKYCSSMLVLFRDSCQTCLNVLIEQGVSSDNLSTNKDLELYQKLYLPYYQKQGAIEQEIKLRDSEIDSVNRLQENIVSERNKIQKVLNFQNYLGKELWNDFIAYRREDTYSNNNYISDGLNNKELFKNALEFINVAKKEAYKSATLQHTITASLKDLLVMKEFEPILKYFEVGNWIRIRIDGKIYRLRIVSYDVDYENLDNINIQFSDVKNTFSGVSDSESIMGLASSMATSYNAVTRQASKGKKSNKVIEDWTEKGLALTKMKIIDDADNQNITWDKHGMLFRKYDPILDLYSDTQLRIINSTLVITDNNWRTTKTAVGNFLYIHPLTGEMVNAYGINAETLVGNLILGEELGIYNISNSLVFDKDGLKITNGSNSFSVNPNNNEKMLCLSNKKQDVLYIDSSGMLHIVGDGSGLDLEANNSVKGLSASVKANSEGITAEVKRSTAAEKALGDNISDVNTTLSSQISQTASSITATVTEEVSRAKTAEKALGDNISDVNTTLSSQISQTASSITLEVNKKVNDSDLNSKIALWYDGITIQSSKINLNGVVTANSYFKINSNGSMECTSGKIAGWDITASGMSKETTFSDGSKIKVHLLNGTGSNKDFLVVMVTDAAGNNSWPFFVRGDGTLSATKATISGNITTGNLTATGGKIANFTISGGYLFNGISIGTAKSCGISCGSSLSGNDNWIFWAGNGVFRVDINGAAVLSNATITGNITATNISIKNNLYMYTDTLAKKTIATLYEYSTGVAYLNLGSGVSGVTIGSWNSGATIYSDGRANFAGYLGIGTSSFDLSCNSAFIDKIDGKVANQNLDYKVPVGSSDEAKYYTNVIRTTSGGLQVYGSFGTAGRNVNKSFAASSSDRRLKHNIVPTKVDNALKQILKISHKEFDWDDGRHIDIGFIAQELEEINESMVMKPSNETEYYGVDTFYLLGLVTKAIQELNQKVEKLKSQYSNIDLIRK